MQCDDRETAMNPDFKELLQLFNANRVEYLIIGGYAVIEYTEPRYTKDLDVWIRAESENAEHVFASLAQFGAPLGDMMPADFATEGYVFQIGVAPVRIDILMSVSGLSFSEAWHNRVAIDFDGLPVWVIALQDLITTKRAAGRPQDLQDVASLERAREERTE
jgi:predicted nucleotidyltransferase